MRARFSPQIIRQVQLGMLFTAGRKQGWLPPADYDLLTEVTAGAARDSETVQQLRQIHRGNPA